MKNWKEIIRHKQFRYLDHSKENFFDQKAYTALTSFAIDDVLALSVGGKNTAPAIRLWVHPDTVVLGIPDARIPFIEEGVELLSEQGYQVVVRNSGGLAVALDAGVLNISLILPDVKHISIHDCYEAMVSFIQYMLRDLTNDIEAYEIVGSYCPGDYDLSIGGRKFAGISQRRVKDGASIQIYLDVEGKGIERAALIRDFYSVGIKGAETKFSYPDVDPSTMASLTELLGAKISVDGMKDRVLESLEHFSNMIVTDEFSADELEAFKTRYEQMVKRNEKIAGMQ
ncbi:lipoate--protein ligase family protein [Virgibacillus litoralis]|uniref:Octanoyl-[GcvH]:protein N-octanoyltransferase n=1 Tax=Virgibacillus litoralis TaxID=578221 RepID=A0ABS4HDF9_9BACI|nr:lipoate--protein ligase family protein [Virgibacillus litoralis]MBP1948898.1 octanoyl-[GcvH]:protein N-octanoyltransferase/lipoyl amidotransferase [Virgibacillus litoralis]